MPPATADLRRFLIDTFDDQELKDLCFDYFRDVYEEFATGMQKTQMIRILIERCVRRDALANLEAALRAERPEQYEKRFGAAVSPVLRQLPSSRFRRGGSRRPGGRRPRSSPGVHQPCDASRCGLRPSAGG